MHSDTAGDLTGIDLFVKQGNRYQKCQDEVEGSGFYHCGYYGRYLKFVQYAEVSSFTICEVSVYTEYNLMQLNPVASTNQPYSGFPVSNLVRTHPVSYSQYGSHGFSTAISGPAPSYMDFTFANDYLITRVVVEGSQDDGSDAAGGINYYVKVLNSSGQTVGVCNGGLLVTDGPHAEVECGSSASGYEGRTVRLQKVASELLIVHALAILGSN